MFLSPFFITECRYIAQQRIADSATLRPNCFATSAIRKRYTKFVLNLAKKMNVS